MAAEGALLVLAARRREELEAVAMECRMLGAETKVIVTDVNVAEECARLIREAGPDAVLVNNAGFAIFDPVATSRPEDLEAMMRTNFFGAVHCTQAVLPQMLQRGQGAIVNVSSIAGLMGFFRMSGYCATKFALTGWTEALRDEVLSSGVTVSLVCPGTTETEFFVTAERGKMPKASRLILTMSPEKVARAICRSVEDGRYRRILPLFATIFMRLKEVAPRTAHFFMRRVSSIME
jgi:short-subunit dehydrogenase